MEIIEMSETDPYFHDYFFFTELNIKINCEFLLHIIFHINSDKRYLNLK